MAEPQRCPLCDGSGLVSWSYQEAPFGERLTAVKDCHACSGKGIVWEPDPELLWMERAWKART